MFFQSLKLILRKLLPKFGRSNDSIIFKIFKIINPTIKTRHFLKATHFPKESSLQLSRKDNENNTNEMKTY